MAKYSREECKNMIAAKQCPHDAPRWVIQEIKRIEREINRKAKSPEQDMHEEMTKAGCSRIVPF